MLVYSYREYREKKKKNENELHHILKEEEQNKHSLSTYDVPDFVLDIFNLTNIIFTAIQVK